MDEEERKKAIDLLFGDAAKDSGNVFPLPNGQSEASRAHERKWEALARRASMRVVVTTPDETIEPDDAPVGPAND